MQFRIAVPSLLFALLTLLPLRCDPASRVPVVLVLLHSSTVEETSSLRSLIVDAITVELEGRDIAAVPSEEKLADDHAVFSLAQREKADFALAGTYTLVEQSVQLSLRWYDVGEKKTFPDAILWGPLDLSFDSVVSHLVGQVLDAQTERLTSLPPLPRPPPASAAPPAAPPAENPSSVGRVPPAAPPKASPLSFSVGSAPFIPVFKASAYIPTVGLSISVVGEYRFPLGVGLLGIIGVSGIDLFHAEKASVADAFAIPIGAGIVYRTLSGSLIDFALRADAGPSIFVLSPGGGGTTIGVVPFFSTGLGVTMNFSNFLAASVDLDYVAILVPDAIMGFVPSVALDMRF
ncbi:MAG: hypothetical protein ABSG17_06490 [Spirochaetia bacterium]|jgi:hypothetical protein